MRMYYFLIVNFFIVFFFYVDTLEKCLARWGSDKKILSLAYVIFIFAMKKKINKPRLRTKGTFLPTSCPSLDFGLPSFML